MAARVIDMCICQQSGGFGIHCQSDAGCSPSTKPNPRRSIEKKMQKRRGDCHRSKKDGKGAERDMEQKSP